MRNPTYLNNNFARAKALWLLTVSVIIVWLISVSYQSGQSQLISADRHTYFCGSYNSFPATIRIMNEGNVPIIRWTSGLVLAGQTPVERCRVVSNRFQRAYENGTLRYIGTGPVNGQSVICATTYKGSNSCLDSAVLLTPSPGTDADVALAQLLNLPAIIAGNPLYQNGDLLLYSEGETFVNIETLTNAVIGTIGK